MENQISIPAPVSSPFSAMPLSVGQFLEAVNLVLRDSPVSVYGEVLEFRESARWISFSLRDREEEAILKCVLGAWQYRKLGVRVEDGMEIKVKGNSKIAKRWGSFGFWVDEIEPLGEGSLKRAYELLLKQLQMEGLFARKRPLPEFIRRVAVLTSRDGVVMQDFRKNLAKRDIKISLIDTRVEGSTAVPGILAGISWVARHAMNFDVLLIMRGGGGLESMQAFNNEAVCRALYAAPLPVIAGIGHDVNVPLAAMVADREVSTPTAAAVAVNQSWDRLTLGLAPLSERILRRFAEALPGERIRRANELIFIFYESALREIAHRGALSASRMLNAYRQVFASVTLLERALEHGANRLDQILTQSREAVERYDRLIILANPERNLRLGYSIATDAHGRVIKDSSLLDQGAQFQSRFAKGSVTAIVKEIH